MQTTVGFDKFVIRDKCDFQVLRLFRYIPNMASVVLTNCPHMGSSCSTLGFLGPMSFVENMWVSPSTVTAVKGPYTIC